MSDLSVGLSNQRPAAVIPERPVREPRTEEPRSPAPQSRYDTVEISREGRQISAALRSGDRDAALDALLADSSETLRRLAEDEGDGRPLSEDVYLPERPRRGPEETEEAWNRRRADYEAAASWSGNLRQWLAAGKDQRELNDLSARWAAELRDSRPALFRQWLAAGKETAGDAELENRVLPRGFQAEEYRAWLEREDFP